jgi:hypothetical protein
MITIPSQDLPDKSVDFKEKLIKPNSKHNSKHPLKILKITVFLRQKAFGSDSKFYFEEKKKFYFEVLVYQAHLSSDYLFIENNDSA